MSAAKHTPGPWSVRIDHAQSEVLIMDSTGLQPIAATYYIADGTMAQPANAKLIAAVPDMAEALRGSTTALANIAAYLVKHQHLLPPCSLTGTELQIERNRAALQKAGIV